MVFSKNLFLYKNKGFYFIFIIKGDYGQKQRNNRGII